MKQIRGIWFPDGDEHFTEQMKHGPLFEGKGTYQFKKLDRAMPFVNEKVVAVDVGGHVGLWARVLASKFDHVIAFEPMPEHVQCFRVNCRGKNNITLKTHGLSDQYGELSFDMPIDNTGHTHVSTTGKHIAQVMPLDALDIERIDFLKIDVEGHEVPVVCGALETIERCRPVIVIEQKPNNAEAQGYRQHEALELLKDLGMREQWVLSGDHCLTWE